jgi:uncharacterized protein
MREHEAQRLDMAAFAAAAATLEGHRRVADFARLRDLMPPDAPDDELLQWQATGDLRRPKAVEPEVWLHLQAHGGVWMTCQRCLQPVRVAVDIDRAIRFVRGEDAAAKLDAESDEDVLELARHLDLPALLEDEVLLALPLVPRHELCPTVLPHAAGPDEADEPASPFAALEALRKRR